MSQLTAGDPDPAAVRSALAILVADEPALPSGSDDIERRGRRRLARRRLGAGLGAAVVVVVAASLAAFSLSGLSGLGGVPTAPIAASPAAPTDGPVDGGGAAGGAQLAGFTVDAAVSAVISVLPGDVAVGDLPVDIGWRDGGRLDVPLVAATGTGTLTLQIADGVCAATVSPAGVLVSADLDAIADAVCAAWVAAGSPPIVPAGPPGLEQPELANQ